MRKIIEVKGGNGFPSKVVKKFLWFPKVIQNEQRWLEFAQWSEKLTSKVHKSKVWFEWEALEWID